MRTIRTVFRKSVLAVVAFGIASASSTFAATIYDNTTTDTLQTYVYSAGAYTQIGDSITLGGTARTLTDASVQFFNLATAGTFSATLRFFNPAAPVGTQIGSSYLASGLSINSQDILTVTFSGLNLLVPNNLVFTVAISNVTGGADLGLNAFEPPLTGSSNNAQIITSTDNVNFLAESTIAGQGNLYLQLNASDVPEPATITLAGGAIMALLILRKRRQ